MKSEGFEALTLVDGHVHAYAAVDPAGLLSAAARNFLTAGERLGCARPVGVLMLTESGSLERFAELQRRGPHQSGPWSIAPLADDSLSLRASDGDCVIYLIAGRQVVTAEGLEVLLLATRSHPADGLPLDRVLKLAAEADAVPVLPWGAGKWLGARGRLVRDCVARVREGAVLLGDNGGRPGIWPTPALIRAARRAGSLVLSGSDPLPLPGEERRAGSFGVAFPAVQLDQAAPAAALKRLFRSPPPSRAIAFGSSLGTLAFVGKQLALRRGRAERHSTGARSA